MRTGCIHAVSAILVLAAAHPLAATDGSTPITRFSLPPGFQAELVYDVPRDTQGSWVCMTVDSRGRLITSDQYGMLYRITPSAIGNGQEGTRVDPLKVSIGMAHGLLYAYDSLYVMVNEDPDRKHGLYRLRDTDGDDQFDELRFLREFRGGGEHGPHGVVLGPDGLIYIAAGNHTQLVEVERSLVPRVWEEDLLLPRMWDAGGHAVDVLAPGGYVVRTDPEGKEFELVGIGYRNQYDLAFNAEGELFTYDSDMEWDIGMPWYRPTRVCHVTSGSDFGWRSGSANAPEYFADNLPPVVNIGPGSPTGIVFGTGAKFPAKYQRALFLCDWSYGLIYAVHLEPSGSSYTGIAEQFASATPLPLTDILVRPQDGALYFTVGGRRTQSALYRIVYVGDEPVDPLAPSSHAGIAERKRRHELEALHAAGPDSRVVQEAWPHLGDADPFIRFAARIAIEHQPVDLWRDRVFAETHPAALIEAAIAYAHCGESSGQAGLLQSLDGIPWSDLTTDQRLDLLRVYGLCFIRLGRPDDASARRFAERFEGYFPTDSAPLNRELASLLVYLNAPAVVPLAIEQMYAAPTQEDRIHYAFILRTHKEGWTLKHRRRYFEWFHEAAATRGGMSFSGFLRATRREAMETLSDTERTALKELLERDPERRPVTVENPARPFVRKWTVEELLPLAEQGLKERSFARGRDLFSAASCYRCHRLAGEGGISGPDLTGIGRRFNNRDLLEALIEPSKVVSDQYAATTFVLSDGRTVHGRVINLFGDSIMVLTNMLDPSDLAEIDRATIEQTLPSPTSMMPEGLLDTLTDEEVLDLVAYLRSGGDPRDPMFR